MTDRDAVSAHNTHTEGNSFFFHVPEESDWLAFHVDCGHIVSSWNVYILRDPLGRVRYQRLDVNEPRTVIIHRCPEQSSLSAVAGPVIPGRWRIDFAQLPPVTLYFAYGNGHVHGAGADFRVTYPDPTREIWAQLSEDSPAFVYSRYAWARSLNSERRWYRGDCHAHTALSDGSLSPEQINGQALANGLEFLVVTDHHILPTSWPKTELLVIPGIEVTTNAGHWLALGPKRWFDWHPASADGGMNTEAGQTRVLRDAAEAGAVRAIAHPRHLDFHWTFHQTPLDQIDAIELINWPQNRDFKQGNQETLAIWTALWNDGYTVPGIGGSDFHHNAPSHAGEDSQQVGDPSTYVYADELSAAGILEGIRQGHTYVSRGPRLVIDITVDGEPFVPGDDLTQAIQGSKNGVVAYRVSVTNMEQGVLCWIENGEPAEVVSINGDATREKCFNWKGREYAWARVDVRSLDGEVVAAINPIYCGAKTPSLRTWAEAVACAGYEMEELKAPTVKGW